MSPDIWFLVEAVKSWARLGVPFPVVSIIWLLRERQLGDGGWYRLPGLGIVETGVVYRYLELVFLAGESLYSDPWGCRAFRFLEKLLENTGGRGFPVNEYESMGETGTTARVVRILLIGLKNIECSSVCTGKCSIERVKECIKSGINFLLCTASSIGEGLAAWKKFPDSRVDEEVVSGATALSILALLYAKDYGPGDLEVDEQVMERAIEGGVKWLLSIQCGGWSEVPGGEPVIDNTFYALWAITEYYSRSSGSIPSSVLESIKSTYEWVVKEGVKQARTLYSVCFIVRTLVLFKRISGDDRFGFKPDQRLDYYLNKFVEKMLNFLPRIYSGSLDLYHVELYGITLLELKKVVSKNEPLYSVLERVFYRLPRNPPRFILDKMIDNITIVSEILYPLPVGKRFFWLIKLLVDIDLLALIVGKTTGLMVVVDLFANLPSSIYSLGREYLYLLLGLSLATNIIWLVIKLLSGRFLQRVIDYVLSIGLAYAIVELYSHYPGIVLSLTLIHGLIIDIVGWIVDKAVLLNAVRGV